MPARHQRLLLAAAFGMCALCDLCALRARGAASGHADLLAYAGPVCLLALPLLAGRYVGEEALERLRRQRPPARRPRLSRALPQGARRVAVLLPRGGRLIAEAL